MSHIRPALVLLVLFTLLLGAAYPAAITGVAQVAFPQQANGSLIERDGQVVGSTLIGQGFTLPEYFWSRPSAAGDGYNASASSGSNYGPTSSALVERVEGDVAHLREAGVEGAIPADLATASGSGLDPHISPAAANAQLARVAGARQLTEAQVSALIEQNTERPFLGILGDPAVNVLTLNLALDAAAPMRN
ncbi:potassium-transporting ATPase C chain [alpha proteobacterium U9-1i]|nr:potassium-transporting ATPase C chain [alpha proteobacterium U9-1i]